MKKGRKSRLFLVGGAITTLLVTVVAVAHPAWGAGSSESGSMSSYKLKGQFTSGAVNLSGPSDTQTVFTTPAAPANYGVTQFCTSVVAGGIQLNAAGVGIAVAGASGSPSCETFSPPVFMPASTALTCSTSAAAPAGSYFCMVNGILSPK